MPQSRQRKAMTQEIIFDQHYTDSLIRLTLGNRRIRPRFPVAKSIAKKDVLLSLLLFDHARLVEPFWLEPSVALSLEPLIKEGLVSFIPREAHTEALERVEKLVDVGMSIDATRREVPMGHIDPSGKITFPHSDLDIRYSELLADKSAIERSLLYFEPVIRAAARHMQSPSSTIKDAAFLVNGWDNSLFGLNWDPGPDLDVSGEFILQSFFDSSADILQTRDEAAAFKAVFSVDDPSDLQELNELVSKREAKGIVANARKLRFALLSAISGIACERYAAHSGAPVRSRATRAPGTKVDRSLGEEAYQLFQVQVKNLRYPVLENIDDVRRLRGSKHLNSYRAIINEYAKEMRHSVERGRIDVIQKFARDLQLAEKDLTRLGRRMDQVDIFSFWISLPIAAIMLWAELSPIDSLAFFFAGAWAQSYKHKMRYQLDWMLLGRS
jgi:hypothetical protein